MKAGNLPVVAGRFGKAIEEGLSLFLLGGLLHTARLFAIFLREIYLYAIFLKSVFLPISFLNAMPRFRKPCPICLFRL